MLIALLRSHLRPYRGPLAGVVALQAVSTIATLYLPRLNADIIDDGVATGNTGAILHDGALMLALTLAQIACSIGAVWLGAGTAMRFGRDVRAAVFDRVATFSAREMRRFGAPSLITRSTNDVQQVQMLVVVTCTMLVTAPIMCIGGIVMAVREDAGLSWLLVVAVPVMLVSIGAVISRMVPQFRAMQVRVDAVNRVLREQITGIRVVRAFVREDVETARFAQASDALSLTALRAGRLMVLIFPIVLFVLNASSVAVLWFGAPRVASGQMGVGSLTAFLAYLLQILMSVMMATFISIMIPRASVCADRIGEVLATRSSVVPPAQPVAELTTRAHLDLHDVTVAHEGASAPVLRGVSFSVRPGTTTAVIGSTGAGKTTLVSLVARLLDVTAGQVLIDGVDVRSLSPATLASLIGYVPQKAYLFSGTVADNLRYGDPDATDAALEEALRVAQAADVVAALPGGLQAQVTQGGTNLSGGQRQRLCIARALVHRPEIYLFDDCFSALDVRTDAALRAALKPWTADAAVLVVAQRVATVRDADQIVVLDDGAVVGVGRHDELLATCETYREIVASQESAESLA